MINKSEGNPNSGEYKKLYRGIWADKLENGDELPVGGSIFSTELTSRLRLDFENFDNQLEGFTADSLAEHYHKGEEAIRSWIEKFKLDVDPALFYVCFSVQAKVDKLIKLHKELDLAIDFTTFTKIYHHATVEKYHFLYVDVRNEKYRKDFNKEFNIQQII